MKTKEEFIREHRERIRQEEEAFLARARARAADQAPIVMSENQIKLFEKMGLRIKVKKA